MAQIALKLKEKTLAQRTELADTYAAKVTENSTVFPNPKPTPAAMTAKTTAIRAKVVELEGKEAAVETCRLELEALSDELDDMLTLGASYVQTETEGVAAKMSLSGLPLKSDGAPLGPLPMIVGAKVTPGDFPGHADLMWPPINGAGSYEIQSSIDPEKEESFTYRMTSNRSVADVPGLPSGTKQYLRVRPIGAKNVPGPWSQPVGVMVP